MIVSFGSKNLRDLCSILYKTYRWLGVPHGNALIQLISDIEAFENAEELLKYLGKDAVVVPERDTFVVGIGSAYQGTFVAVGAKLQRNTTNQVVWSSVQRLKLTEVGRVHDGS